MQDIAQKLYGPFLNACGAYYDVVSLYGYGTPLIHDPILYRSACGYQVDEHYLEKSQIKLWSCHRLVQVLESSGHWSKEQFRPTFLPILTLVLEYFLSNNDLVTSETATTN
jgi:hypothetical protein